MVKDRMKLRILYKLHTKRVSILTFIVGFAIGAGILGLPIKFGTSGAGFIPSMTMLLIVLIFQIITALYIVEGLDIIGPAEYPALMNKSLGKIASVISYISIAIFLIGAMTAYIIFGGVALYTLSHGIITQSLGMVIYWLIGVLITVGGSRIVAKSEEIMVAFIFFLLVINVVLILYTPYVSLNNLLWGDWSKVFNVFGVVLFAYSIHAAIPTAYRSFGLDTKYNRLLSIGLTISAIIYIVWSASYMSILEPNDYTKTFTGALTGNIYHGLAGLPAPIAVAELGKLRVAALLGYIFGFFTTITSFIAASHSLSQINLEILRRTKRIKNLKVIIITTFIPLILALLNLGNFNDWLNFAGAIGASLFTGILPAILAIYLRIRFKGAKFYVPGGILVAIITLAFYIYGMLWYIINR